MQKRNWGPDTKLEEVLLP